MKRYRRRIRLKTKVEKSRRYKNIIVWTTLLLAAMLFVSFIVNKSSKCLLTSPFFNVKSIEVKGNNIVEKNSVIEYLNLYNKNIFRPKFKKTEIQLKEKFLAIKDVYVKRRIPNKIVVEIIERVPLAEYKVAEKRVGIDEYLKLFVLPDDYRILPKISENINTDCKTACLMFLKNVNAFSIYKKIKAVTSTASDDVTFFLDDNCKVCIGLPDNIDNKINYLEQVFSDMETKGEKAEYINMRDFSDEHKEIIVKTKKSI